MTVPLSDASHNLRGVLAMLAGMFGFVTNDMFVKLASETMPLGQIVFLRGAMTTVILFALVAATGALAELRKVRGGALGLRTIGEAMSTICYLIALAHIPIADATAILQAMPLIMTIAAAAILGETVRWRRWLAVGIGFVGMLMVVRPGGEAFSVYSLSAVAALVFMTLRDLSTRFIPEKVPGLVISLCGSAAAMLAGLALGLGETWPAPGPRDLALIVGAAVSLTIGYFFLVAAMRHGEMSVVAPFRYSILVWAILYGFAVWGELPDGMATAGILLIVGSGLFVFHREGGRRPPTGAQRL